MLANRKKCWKCKEELNDKEAIQYVSPGMKNFHSYCNECFQKQKDFDDFKLKVVSIFGGDEKLWPRIMRDRRNLIDNFGFTDKTIIDCLDYLYNVKKMKILSRSLALVTPSNIEEMKKYKRAQATSAGHVTAAAATEIVEHKIYIREDKKEPQEENLDAWFE